MKIRLATTDDLPDILSLLNFSIATSTAVYVDEPSNLELVSSWFEERTAQSFPITVAEHNGCFAGYGSYGSFRARPGYRFTVEHSVYVLDEYQGNGIGSALLEDLIDRARSAGMHSMMAGIDGENPGSIKFHEQHGFKVVATIPEAGFKFNRWLTLILMQKLL